MDNKSVNYPQEFATIRNNTVVEHWKKFRGKPERVRVRNWPTINQARMHAAHLNQHNRLSLYY